MKYRFISDSHIHSVNSFDGKDSVMMIAERASQLGLYALTITDHFECHELDVHDYPKDLQASVRDATKAAAFYHDRLRIYKGIELGQPTQNPQAAKDALAITDFDFVLGSLHNLKGEQDFYFLTYTEDNYQGYLDRYFRELLELAEADCFDSLAHLTYPFRYMAANPDIAFTAKPYSEMIDAVLLTLIRNRKALEVNTSGLRQRIGTTLPDESIVRRFRQLGGKYVTVGSDAHRWCDVGAGVEDGYRMLERCGFSHFTIYVRHEPVMLPF